MKKHLFFELVFLLSVFPITMAQNPIDSVIKKAAEVFIPQQQQAPTITLVADRNPVQIGEQVKFTLQPEDITTNSPFTYTINFGEGSQAVKENGKSYFYHEYRSAGSFTVSVSIDLRPGLEIFDPTPVMANEITMQVEIVSLFVEPTNVEVGQTVSFETKFKSKNENLRYNFNFGDNSSSDWITDQRTTHTYSTPGTYFASAEINGLDGNSLYPIAVTERKQIDVKTPFSVKLTSDNINPKVYDKITLTATSNRQENGLEYWFNFGDNTPIQKSLRPVITKIFAEPGDFNVSVQLAPNGNPLEVSSVILIKALPITIELIAGNTNVYVGDLVTFSVLTNSTNQDTKYFFNFGDNEEVTVSNISSINHTYLGSGYFTASVQLAINNEPITEPATLDIKISPQIEVTLQADKPNAIEGEQIKFKATTSSTENGFRYEFRFDNNTPSQTINNSTISHTYLNTGEYNASVKLIKDGRVLSKSDLIINISSRQYIVNLKVDKPDSQQGDTLTFTATSNYYEIGLKYLFNFRDDTPVQIIKDSIIQHVYKDQGNFTASVQLLVNNIRQAQDSVALRINLLPPDSVSLSVDSDSGETGSAIIFTAKANHQRSGLEYWFYTGDTDQPIRTLKDSIHYSYSDTGKYIAFVKLILNGRETAISSNVEIDVISDDFPWWPYPLAALLIVGVGFLGKKYVKGKPKKGNNIPDVRPTFHPYPDKGSSNIKELKKFSINYEIHFNPNLANAIHLLKTNKENLIKLKTVKQ